MRSRAKSPLLRETLLALMVLALTFLNFGHTNAVMAAGGRVVITTTSFCGNPFLPTDGDHAPCPACAIGTGADLPPAPCVVAPVAFAVGAVTYDDVAVVPSRNSVRVAAQPRAPPVAA